MTRLLILALLAAACGPKDQPAEAGEKAGRALASSVGFAVRESVEAVEPYHCAALRSDAPTEANSITIGERQILHQGSSLSVSDPAGKSDRRVVIGVVADGREGGEAMHARLAAARAAFEDRGVEIVLSLGGMAEDSEQIQRALDVLSKGAPWPLVALPGDREDLRGHRDAIAALTRADLPVYDGSEVRAIEIDGATIATLPGVGHAEHLVAGLDGCVHSKEDAIALASELASAEGLRIWAGYAPPRQRGPHATDLAKDGIHVGELMLGRAVLDSRAHLIIHGLVDEAALGNPSGKAALGARPLYLASGAIDALPVFGAGGAVFGSALIITASPNRVQWQRILFDQSGARIERR